ncbi:hypothetical protein [Streptomyces sp. NBC_00151]|uniref:hypothetical protein n=1 Tax=Streptomyces sp. NBC_00151 TaxID=2975669 RepID=UPI002DDC85A5|nr:hypothetical protein [Streptomyces sp. NBC_00151]WRZ37997.1 hypothetical protein OG915_07970 [Streptomyces sp. NBC_00151]
MAYLYNVDNHRRSRADVETLVKQLYARCTDDVMDVEFAAAKTATDLVDAQHDHQDVYPILAQLAADFPKGDGKQRCATGLGAVAKRLKAQHA